MHTCNKILYPSEYRSEIFFIRFIFDTLRLRSFDFSPNTPNNISKFPSQPETRNLPRGSFEFQAQHEQKVVINICYGTGRTPLRPGTISRREATITPTRFNFYPTNYSIHNFAFIIP